MNEIFGEENFVATFIWKSRQNKDNRNITGVSIDHEYIVCYSRNYENKTIKGNERKLEQYSNPDSDPRGNWASGNMVGILPENSNEIIVYNDSVKADSLIYLTPTSTSNSISQLTIGQKQDCSQQPIGCKKYFKVVVSTPSILPTKFNWLIVN